MRRAIGVLLVAGLGCLNTAEPAGFVYQYGIGVYACDPAGCELPDTTVAVSAAAPGDTVWVRHVVILLQAGDSTHTATIRPGCAANVLVHLGADTVQSLPTPAACPDSTAPEEFTLGVPLMRLTQWALDPALMAGTTYAVVGKIMIQPRIEPTFAFQVVQ